MPRVAVQRLPARHFGQGGGADGSGDPREGVLTFSLRQRAGHWEGNACNLFFCRLIDRNLAGLATRRIAGEALSRRRREETEWKATATALSRDQNVNHTERAEAKTSLNPRARLRVWRARIITPAKHMFFPRVFRRRGSTTAPCSRLSPPSLPLHLSPPRVLLIN